MNRVIGRIYCGSYEPILEKVDLKEEFQITHILSLVKGDIPKWVLRNYTVMQIPVDDVDSENIIDHFQEANQFIESAVLPADEKNKQGEDLLKKGHRGAIYIHCAQGVSRSVAFTMAYLIYKHNLSVAQALAVMRKQCGKQVGPNEGFMEQLDIYYLALLLLEEGQPRSDIDLNILEAYRSWVFRTLMSDSESRNKYLERKGHAPASKSGALTELRCKKCRQPLALSTSFIPHERPLEGTRHANFFKTSAYLNRIIGVEKASDYCSHIFVEPLNWMKEELQNSGELLGKLYCPNSKCGTKVGAYCWKGSRCSCGKWVVPAINLQTAKVDEAFVSTNENFEKIKRTAKA